MSVWSDAALNESGRRIDGRKLSVAALRAAPWVVFGPITGVMSEAAFRCFRAGRPILGSAWVLLNVAILLGIPTLTAFLAARL